MTLSYSIGLTTGSAVAYGLDFLLGPFHDFCHNSVPTFAHNFTTDGGRNLSSIIKTDIMSVLPTVITSVAQDWTNSTVFSEFPLSQHVSITPVMPLQSSTLETVTSSGFSSWGLTEVLRNSSLLEG